MTIASRPTSSGGKPLPSAGEAAYRPAMRFRVLEFLENEIVSAMGLLGVSSLDQLDASYLSRAESVTPPHEMSAWVNLRGISVSPGGRIL